VRVHVDLAPGVWFSRRILDPLQQQIPKWVFWCREGGSNPAAFQTLKHKLHKPADPVLVRQGPRFDTRSWFVPCLQDAEIEGYVWHCNRHTFCSWLAMAGASIKEIQELAGHKTITMSARYSHLSPEHRLSVIDRIASSTIRE